MTRYIDSQTKCELIPGIHDVSGAIEFPDDYWFFRRLPAGKQIEWETDTPYLRDIIADESQALAESIRYERDGLLANFYAPAIQQLSRWIDNAEGDSATLGHYKAQRSAWHAWADALCDLPDHLDWPWPDGDVPWPEQPPKPTRYNPT